MRKITPEQANAAYDILVRWAGARADTFEREAFIYHVAKDQQPANEYRFGGYLNWGGKFRNNGNNGDVPHVDCYREHLDREREAVIASTNAALAELFGPPETPSRSA